MGYRHVIHFVRTKIVAFRGINHLYISRIDDETKTVRNSPKCISEDPNYKQEINQVAYDHKPGPFTWSNFNPDEQLVVRKHHGSW